MTEYLGQNMVMEAIYEDCVHLGDSVNVSVFSSTSASAVASSKSIVMAQAQGGAAPGGAPVAGAPSVCPRSNWLAALDRVHHVHPRDDVSDDGVLPVKKAAIGEHDEELAVGRIRR